jgi:uncharacterized protein YlxW (UPF0749 family)
MPEPVQPPPSPDEAPGERTADVREREPFGLRRIFDDLRGRPGRGQVIVAVLLAVLGFAFAVQLRLAGEEGAYAGARRGDLVNLLDSLDTANDRANRQIQELRATREELQDNSTATQAALEQAREEAETLAILAGSVGATGPGVEITIEDPEGRLSSSELINTVQELRNAGAEAIEINDQVRVVAQTYFVDDGDEISADGIPVAPPYVIEAIGDPATMSTAASFNGGLRDVVESLDATVQVREVDSLDITALSVRRDPDYARPAS